MEFRRKFDTLKIDNGIYDLNCFPNLEPNTTVKSWGLKDFTQVYPNLYEANNRTLKMLKSYLNIHTSFGIAETLRNYIRDFDESNSVDFSFDILPKVDIEIKEFYRDKQRYFDLVKILKHKESNVNIKKAALELILKQVLNSVSLELFIKKAETYKNDLILEFGTKALYKNADGREVTKELTDSTGTNVDKLQVIIKPEISKQISTALKLTGGEQAIEVPHFFPYSANYAGLRPGKQIMRYIEELAKQNRKDYVLIRYVANEPFFTNCGYKMIEIELCEDYPEVTETVGYKQIVQKLTQ